MYVKFKDGIQDVYPVWENVVLIDAITADEALKKAEEIGRAEEGDAEGSMFWQDRPAVMTFGGIRKITECENASDRPTDGTELTYSSFEVKDIDSFSKLIGGEPVEVLYEE